MIRRVSSTTVRPISSIEPARLRRADAACRTPSWAARGLGLLEELGVRERDGGVRREGRDEGDVAVGPGARLERDRRQRADDAVVVDQRGDELAGELEHAVVAVVAVLAHAADVLARDHPAGAQHLAGPALVAAEDREVAATSSLMPAQAATSRRSSRRIRIVVLSARSARIVSSTMVRNSSCRSWDSARRSAMPRTESSRSASSTSRGVRRSSA